MHTIETRQTMDLTTEYCIVFNPVAGRSRHVIAVLSMPLDAMAVCNYLNGGLPPELSNAAKRELLDTIGGAAQ